MDQTKTLGAQRLRLDFNPSSNEKVDQIKKLTADIIDLLESFRTSEDNVEKKRLLDIAQNVYEDAAMWAVKGATFN